MRLETVSVGIGRNLVARSNRRADLILIQPRTQRKVREKFPAVFETPLPRALTRMRSGDGQWLTKLVPNTS